jgi:hypothetical protein
MVGTSMELVARLRWSRTAAAVLAALDGAAPVLVVGAPGLARVLARRGVRAFAVHAAADVPARDGALGGLVLVRAPDAPDEWRRALRPGGAVVVVAAGPEAELARRALCAGLVDPEQRRAGRLVVTSGRTRSRARPAPG